MRKVFINITNKPFTIHLMSIHLSMVSNFASFSPWSVHQLAALEPLGLIVYNLKDNLTRK
jgi:hypothetical protein